MGHLGHLREEYRALLGRLARGPVGLPEPAEEEARAAWREILEIYFTPEEADLASKLPVKPAGLTRIAARWGMEPEDAERRLSAMAEKGLAMDFVHPQTGKIRYILAPPVVGFFELSMMRAQDMYPKKRLAEALHAYMERDPAFAREVFGGDTVVGRALVHEEVVADEVVPEVLDFERATQIVKDARAITVSLCFCRHKAGHLGHECGAPKENCLALNAAAEFVERRGFGRRIDAESALAILAEAKQAGLVQIGDNVRNRPLYICNCCACCCEQLAAVNKFDLHAVNPSGYLPAVDVSECHGCSRCSRACPVAAITMKAEHREHERKNVMLPSVDTDRCIGCGVCASTCKRGALRMRRLQQRPFVSADPLERVVRMSVEHGRLADLLFDAGESRGHAFLNRVLRVLVKLPPASRMLAEEQSRSRFVQRILKRVPGRDLV